MPEDDALRLQMYYDMVLGRAFELRAEALAHRGLVPGSIHLGIGEEATQVGAVRALAPDDYLMPSHRCHVADLVKGSDPRRLLAELTGRAGGYCEGRGGTAHFADRATYNLGVQGIIGAVFPVAVGAGLAQQRLAAGHVVLAFFGDGASNQGTFHEAMNLSSLWKLPIVWVCANNQYGMGTRFDRTSAVTGVAERACAYAMPGVAIDGNDVVAVYEAAGEAVERARTGGGPTLIECLTYRHRGHSTFDKNSYRPQAEIDAWLQRDPVPRFERRLRDQGLLDDASVAQIGADVARCVDEAEAFTLASPDPAPERALDLIFCPSEEGRS
jgi:acetoin:2,6-dichlorophenolindophenol oxidoreductase subunit alpha